MKILKNDGLFFSITIMFIFVLVGCQKGDADADFGFGYIYIPQATVSNGLNNYYMVPSGSGINTNNYIIENGKLNIFLGVLRSGKLTDNLGFTVNIVVSSNMTDEVISSSDIPNSLPLPLSLYSLPSNVTVKLGENSASFFLSVDIDLLMNGTYDGKNLVLALKIDEPTNYQLSDENTSVIVVIDVDAIRDILFSIT